jgi:SAM-dependent methyltransferase
VEVFESHDCNFRSCNVVYTTRIAVAMESMTTVAARRAKARDKDEWTLFWADEAQSRCSAGAPEIWAALQAHWDSLARSLPRGARVLDLGCGAGAVGRMLLAARDDLQVTGIDSAKIPPSNRPQLDLISETGMESMPFEERSFAAVVSQFGYEYSHADASAREISRVMAPDAKLSFVVHHAASAIVAETRARHSAVMAFLGAPLREAFCGGDVSGFNAQITLLVQRYPNDTLIAELARALPSRLGWMPDKRVATWETLEQALAPEQCISDSLLACCVAPAQMTEWLGPLREVSELFPVAVLREANGTPIGWKIEGTRGAANL